MAFVEITEPDYQVPPPKTVLGMGNDKHVFEHKDGATYFSGRGKKKNPDIMFVASCPLEEELDSRFSPSLLLKGAPGALFARSCDRAGLELENHYYTTLCKYCLPRKKKLKPSAEDIKRCSLIFERELKQRKPKVVVCLGKTVFDYFFQVKLNEKEVMGGWFDPESKTINHENDDGETVEFGCYRDFKLFVTHPVHLALHKPEVLESQSFDLLEVRKHLEQSTLGISKSETNYRLLDSEEKVDEWADEMLENGYRMFSVDCEWSGEDYLSGELRSVQVCWKEGHAMMLQFFDENDERPFDGETEKRVVERFKEVMNREEVRFIGHNFSADSPWLKHHLGVDTYNRCMFDTMYAMHTADESYDLKLERLSVRFTDLGRYDIPLTLWKKSNGQKLKEKGYGAIPTDIIFPYGCKDVDVPFRCYPKLTNLLLKDKTLEYYLNIKLPFVTDGYAHMHENGIPLHKQDTEHVRKMYNLASCLMLDEFKKRVKKSANRWLLGLLLKKTENPREAVDLYEGMITGGKGTEDLKQFLGPKDFADIYKKFLHWQDAQNFNPNSSHHKMRWLFDFKEFEPVKSTSNDGSPSVSWEKVKELPQTRQKEYTPSTDKDVLQVYAHDDDDCQLLVEQLAVYQVIKSFLKSEDQGLEAFIRNDGCVHSSFMSTETNRPRSVKIIDFRSSGVIMV